jgi:demethylmenaquinone methyltransferase/2-methoxy-6-polyprenyl-1,4-benzoquinol methylase
VESIRGFPSQTEIRDLMQHVGFADVRYYNLSMGIACIHCGTRPEAAN